MSESDPTRDAVAQARDVLLLALRHGDEDKPVIARIGRICVGLLRVDGASISLIIDTDRREVLYTSDEVVARVEALQFSLGEGPCFEAFTTGRPVLVADLHAATISPWPIFAAEMADQPVGAIFAFPLTRGAIRLGAMDLYRERPGSLSATDVAVALQVVDMVTLVVLGTDPRTMDAPWWNDLPTNRVQVHQATGMLIAALHIPAHHALARLRGYAFAGGRLVDDVADDLVARRINALDFDKP
ncbi:GAF and ANTAR domain-containing protein [Nocardia tengchongensis]|uniref:GAF and ANTAR domain-containing protein n=1 Tax=Nocardia tengchongensis TaxID=2055889 RepID=UPI0036502524